MNSLLRGDLFLRLWQDMKDTPGKWLARAVYLLGPWFCFSFVEIMNNNSLFKDFELWQVFFNLIWYYIFFFISYLVLGRIRRAGALTALILFAIGLLNHYILRFRGRIIFPADLSAWKTAANVADGFDFSLDVPIRQALILLIAYLFLLAICPRQKRRSCAPWMVIGGTILTGAYIYAFFFTSMLPSLNIYTQQWVTSRNGFLLNFTTAMRYSAVDRPQGYSMETVEQIMSRYPALPGDDTVPQPANLIVIMNEAFSDLTIFDALEPSQDPTPFLHSMQENTIRGYMYSPVTGGGTASVEFEYLTGFSNFFLPPHCVAYQLYVDQNTPAISNVMGELGYATTFFHPYLSSGWNRPLVYSYFGFDRQLYNVDVPQPQYVRRYISDACDYEVLQSLTQRTDTPNFIFNVTMQNHSGFSQGWNHLSAAVVPGKAAMDADETSKQYLSLVRCSDEALQQLIEYYEQVEEPTLIVFFGDHQPSLSNAFYQAMYGKPLDDRTTQEVLQQYATPFFLWANYDIPEQQDVIISTNYLGALTAKVAGLPLTGWMNFLLEMYEQLPVITPVGFLTPDGTAVAHAQELSAQQQQWLSDYEMLCYCGLIDRESPMRSFYLDTQS